jgi:hypothetical protein
MYSVTLNDLDIADVTKLKEVFHQLVQRHKCEWSFPAGDSRVTVVVDGPSHRKESEILQYAIDVLEVAKKHCTD